MKIGYSRWLIAAGIVASLVGCQTPSEQLPNSPNPNTPVTLSAGDVIKVTFPGAAELNQTQKIRTDGKVNLPIIGEVSASGKTPSQLREELIRLYKPQLSNSDVLITLESGNGRVVVSGAVSKPGNVEFDRPTTVFQAIMQAGGTTQYGSLKKVRLFRTIKGEQHSQVLDLSGSLKGKPSQVVYVRDGDVIYVQESAF